MTERLAGFIMVACLGCAAPSGTTPTAGYILLDREAFTSGALTVGAWRGAPRLPIAADQGDSVNFVGVARTRTIPWRPQKLTYVRGESAEIEWLDLAYDARGNAIVLDADAPTAGAVAMGIGGSTTADEDGNYRVTAPDIYGRLAFSREPEGLSEAWPAYASAGATFERLAPLQGPPSAQPDHPSRPLSAEELVPLGADESLRLRMDLVGVYAAGGMALLLDAAGRFTLEQDCAGRTTTSGRYRPVRGGVVLESLAGPIVLSTEGETLASSTGEHFTPMQAARARGTRRGRGAEYPTRTPVVADFGEDP